jgi:hypothetical protein
MFTIVTLYCEYVCFRIFPFLGIESSLRFLISDSDFMYGFRKIRKQTLPDGWPNGKIIFAPS